MSKTKFVRKRVQPDTMHNHTKNEVSSSNGSKVMTKSLKPEEDIKN